LYTLYLTPNFTTIVEPLYVLTTSSNPLVRLTAAYELRQAATTELLKHSAVINGEALYKDAEDAFGALETLLGDKEWFFGAENPGLFDASVFSYTHLLLDGALGNGWVEARLREGLGRREGLVKHRERILRGYFPGM
jgi:metaxin